LCGVLGTAVADNEIVDERTVAVHEAGHVVQYFLEGCEIEAAELGMTGESLGFVKPVSASSAKLANEQHVRISLAGIAAEFVLGRLTVPTTEDELFSMAMDNEGWEPDWDRTYYYALQVVGEEKYEAADQFRFQQFGEVLKLQHLHRDKVALVASQLLKERRLTGHALKSLLGAP
jgi:hypothetical protein